jgi:hypothetical protein
MARVSQCVCVCYMSVSNCISPYETVGTKMTSNIDSIVCWMTVACPTLHQQLTYMHQLAPLVYYPHKLENLLQELGRSITILTF